MKRGLFLRQLIGFCALALAMFIARPADAAFIQLSTHATGNNDPAEFDALLDFTVSGNNLTLAVTNQTTAPNAFQIREIFFNTTPEVTSLTPVSLPTGFSLDPHSHAGGFGWFDYGIIGANGGNAVIAPGETKIFEFTFTGNGVTESSFTTELSDSNNKPMVAAAKFVIGQGNSGGYGGSNVIPTPGSTAMILLALVIGGPLRSRKPRVASAR